MKSHQLAPLVLAAASTCFASAASAQGLSDAKVRIGVMTDLAGIYSESAGQGSVEAARLAIEDFGGKVLGKPIELVAADHQNKADIASSVARTWFDRDGVDVVVDLNNSSVALAVVNLAKERQKVTLNTGAGSTLLTNESCAPTSISYVYDTDALAMGAVRGIAATGGKSWYVIGVDYAFGKSMAASLTAFAGETGGKVVGSVFHPLNTGDFSSYILQAQTSGAQTIALANSNADLINTVKTAQQFGITARQRITPMLMFITDVHAMSLKTAQGMTFADGFYWDRTPESRAWSRRYFERMKKMPTMIQAGAYSAVTHYLKAIAAAGTDEGAAVTAQMKRTPVNDFFAKNGVIRADGRMVHDMYLVSVKKPEESKSPWDYYTVLNTIPGDQAFQPLSKSKCALVK